MVAFLRLIWASSQKLRVQRACLSLISFGFYLADSHGVACYWQIQRPKLQAYSFTPWRFGCAWGGGSPSAGGSAYWRHAAMTSAPSSGSSCGWRWAATSWRPWKRSDCSMLMHFPYSCACVRFFVRFYFSNYNLISWKCNCRSDLQSISHHENDAIPQKQKWFKQTIYTHIHTFNLSNQNTKQN